MTKKLEQEFFDRFKFFHPNKSPQETLMCFGFECGDGWRDLLWQLCEDLDVMEKTEGFEVLQVKEKFGSLRFYINYGSDEIFDRIDKAEKDSETVCEICGKASEIDHSSGWMRSVCKKHRGNE